MNRDPKKPPMAPQQFSPFYKPPKPKKGAGFAALKAMFVPSAGDLPQG